MTLLKCKVDDVMFVKLFLHQALSRCKNNFTRAISNYALVFQMFVFNAARPSERLPILSTTYCQSDISGNANLSPALFCARRGPSQSSINSIPDFPGDVKVEVMAADGVLINW